MKQLKLIGLYPIIMIFNDIIILSILDFGVGDTI